MTEAEYIDATNLCRIRAAQNLLRDVLINPLEKIGSEVIIANRALHTVEQALAKKVKIS